MIFNKNHHEIKATRNCFQGYVNACGRCIIAGSSGVTLTNFLKVALYKCQITVAMQPLQNIRISCMFTLGFSSRYSIHRYIPYSPDQHRGRHI